jgi:uncharacterized protein with GYD domain
LHRFSLMSAFGPWADIGGHKDISFERPKIPNVGSRSFNEKYAAGRVQSFDGCQEPRLSCIRPWKFRVLDLLNWNLRRETEMPMFITYASYSQSGAKGLIDKPADRSGVIKALIEKAGGKLIALYFTTGSNDVVLVSEVADGSDAVAVGMAVSASGALSKIETVRAWNSSEFKGIAEKAAKIAGAYTPPGRWWAMRGARSRAPS